MAETKYTFSVTGDFPNQKVSVDRLTQEIQDSTVTIALSFINVNGDNCDIWFKDILSSDNSSALVAIISTHSGEALSQTATPVQVESYADGITTNVSLQDEFRDKSGKLRVHQTSRKDGLAIHWTGCGDDRSNPKTFGCGVSISYKHVYGDSTSDQIYIDFNGLLNESWIHEVVLTWHGCELDKVTVDVVPDICMIADSTAGNFTKYESILLPAVPGTGNCNIISDVMSYTGGLVAKDNPTDPTQSPSPAFWNADFNESTGRFENLTAAPNGDGEYNIFHKEQILSRIFNKIQLLKNGFQIFNSSDADQVTHGYRIKCTFETILPDHGWTVSGILVMHRANVKIKEDGTI
jgi:hypothetical protein